MIANDKKHKKLSHIFHILYNPNAKSGNGKGALKYINKLYSDHKPVFKSVLEISSFKEYIDSVPSDEDIMLCGGDGTLNYFVNSVDCEDLKNNIYLFPYGSGNDFARDIGVYKKGQPVIINEYIKNLPTVKVNGVIKKFVNGIGYGLDGYCCEIRDILREKQKKANYSLIAFNGLMKNYKPTSATITVDGEKFVYDKVWLAPSMKGRYYGGGIMMAPCQDRLCKSNEISSVVVHSVSRIRALMLFVLIYTGQHSKYTDIIKTIKGKSIQVSFDRPAALQIDGETIRNVLSYEVYYR